MYIIEPGIEWELGKRKESMHGKKGL